MLKPIITVATAITWPYLAISRDGEIGKEKHFLYPNRLNRQDSYDASGVLDGYWIYSYNNNSLERTDKYNRSDVRIEYSIYIYDSNGYKIRVDLYNEQDSNFQFSILEYDSAGRPIIAINYDNNGKQISRSMQSFISTSKIKSKVEYYDVFDLLTSYKIFDYDQTNRRIKSTAYDASGKIRSFGNYTYTGGLLSRVITYINSSTIDKYRAFTFENKPTTEDYFLFGNW